MTELRVRTSRHTEAKEITADVLKAIHGRDGKLVNVYTLHTTCGLCINENADPSVMDDILHHLDRSVPRDHPYKHREGNSDAHIKSITTGCSLSIPLRNGLPLLGTWQGIFLMEFDGPRERKVIVTVL